MYNVVMVSMSMLDGFKLVQFEHDGTENEVRFNYPNRNNLDYVNWVCEALNSQLEKDEQEEKKIQDMLDNELMEDE